MGTSGAGVFMVRSTPNNLLKMRAKLSESSLNNNNNNNHQL